MSDYKIALEKGVARLNEMSSAMSGRAYYGKYHLSHVLGSTQLKRDRLGRAINVLPRTTKKVQHRLLVAYMLGFDMGREITAVELLDLEVQSD